MSLKAKKHESNSNSPTFMLMHQHQNFLILSNSQNTTEFRPLMWIDLTMYNFLAFFGLTQGHHWAL